jgi:hypothetical protein
VKTAVNLRVQYKMEFISKRLITPKEWICSLKLLFQYTNPK